MKYSTTLDNVAKAVTIGISLLFTILIIFHISIGREINIAILLLSTIPLLLAIVIAFALRPVYYQLESDKLIIHRLMGDVVIKRSDIVAAERIDKKLLQRSVRTFGSGGLFGYFGSFSNSKIGSMTWYATRRDKAVLLKINSKRKIILSPDEPDRFIVEILSQGN